MPFLKTAVQDHALAYAGRPADRSVELQPPEDRHVRKRLRHALTLLFLSLVAIAIVGYHPYAEDAGIYVSGIKQAIHPGLYGSSAYFIAPYLRASLFPDLSAWIVTGLHLPLEYLLFTMQVLTTWLLLYACWGLARRCFDRVEEQWSSLLLITVCLSIPVAGSSLFLMDPYLTGRSFSTPLSLLAIAACLDGKLLRTGLLLVLIGLFHPLMVIYTAFFVLLLWTVRARSWIGTASVCAVAFACAAAVQLSQRSTAESAAYQNAVGSRYYFFLANWHWYEQVGVIAPLLLLGAYAYWRRGRGPRDGVFLATGALFLGLTSIVIALVFAREHSHSHLVAALQPLRPFLLIYLCMFLILGGVVGGGILRQSAWRWVVLFGGIAIGLAYVQHDAYSASRQLELPGIVSQNSWMRAFIWIRENAPATAIFALDSDYIHAQGEDSQGFRAIAERDSLADRSKDGGAAAVFHQLADRWMAEQSATSDLNRIDDSERLRRLKPFHVDWMVLDASARTQMDCPFANDAVKVCRLR